MWRYRDQAKFNTTKGNRMYGLYKAGALVVLRRSVGKIMWYLAGQLVNCQTDNRIGEGGLCPILIL